MTSLVWFRNDLRCLDNAALHAACQSSDSGVRAVFLIADQQFQQHDMAQIKAHYIRRALDELAKNLALLGIPLDFLIAPRFDDAPAALNAYVAERAITTVYANKEHLVNEIRRDANVTAALSIPCHFYDDHLLARPGSITNQQGNPYKVFTPFCKTLRQKLNEDLPRCLPRPKAHAAPLEPNRCPEIFSETDSTLWPVSEKKILENLKIFCRERSPDYKAQRDFPALQGTSQISAPLAIGLISVRQCLARLFMEQGDDIWQTDTGAGCWLNELIWREFYYHLYYQMPHPVKGLSFKPQYDQLRWRNDRTEFESWCAGKTGYPIVDAAMRQLNQTGWMHNRLRMIVASFLVKDLQIDWRWGERYFMENLIDGDFASNNGGWQWASSSGCDAAPYFRIFNPTTQGERFDKSGEFIKHFIPELAGLEKKALHQPRNIEGYPAPIVDHKQAREITLSMYKAIT